MAHLVETMAYAGEVPWHGLGHKVPSDLSTDQMMQAAGLDWTVQKIPAFVKIEDESQAIDAAALVRSSDNKILDVVSSDWNPVQNQEAFDFFQDFVNAGDMEMHTAGSLKGGQIVWALAKIKDSFELFGGDQVDSYMLFTNPHVYGQSLDIRFTPIRVVCNNTLTLSLSQKNGTAFKLSHRREFVADQAKQALGIAHAKLDEYKSMASWMGSKRYDNESIKAYFQDLFPSQGDKDSRNAIKALEVLELQPGAKFAEGSWWQAFNAVTYMTDHLMGRSNDARLQSAWFGVNKSLKNKALQQAIYMANAA
jgi:phage/plasmid-like protein (TIGR03299 family)